MKFYFHNANEMLAIEFGETVRGLIHKGERPLNCYISAYELEVKARPMPELAKYLHQIQFALAVGGRVEIKST